MYVQETPGLKQEMVDTKLTARDVQERRQDR